MKNISKILLLLLLTAGVISFTGCKDEDPIVTPVTDEEHTGAITADQTWSADKIHYLKGRCWVEAGATLTIEKGAIIKGRTGTEANASALIIARGAKINAVGTADEPIIFTTELDNIALGQKTGTNLTETDIEKWGGLIILGKAKISAENGDIEAQIEGIPATETYGTFGGSDDADNSGTLTYVSIRHGGALIGDGNEINGLTLGGVGNGTTINFIEIAGTLDDGIECFGGSVNINNAIISYQGDDGIDLDMNYSGTFNNFMVIHGGDTDEGLEIDGPEGITYTNGLFTLKNGTVISKDGNGSAADLKSKAQGTIEDCFFTGYTKYMKVRANFDEANACAAKSDAYSYMTSTTAKLIVKNSTFNATALTDVANAYTAVTACAGGIDESLVDTAISSNGNTIGSTSAKGADISQFTNWTWISVNGKL